MEAGRIAAGSGRAWATPQRLDPFSLPVRFEAADEAADGRRRIVDLHRERVVLRRSVRGMRMALNMPVAAYRGVARAYLTELARVPEVRQALYPTLKEPGVTKDEKTGLAQVLAASGGQDAVGPLEALSQDTDAEVSQEGLRAVKNLRARLP